MKHVPNTLTILRLVVAPIVVVLLFYTSTTAAVAAAVLFILAAITDWLDGRLARRYQVGSRLGQFLDPLADKVLVLGTFFALSLLRPEQIPLWAVSLIAFRAVAVTVLRSWMEARGRSLRTSQYGKWKTAAQLTFLIAFLIIRAAAKVTGWPWLDDILNSQGVFIALLLVVAMTLFSGAHYFWPERTPRDPVS